MNQYFVKNKFTITLILFIVISIVSMFFTTSSFLLTPKIIFGAIAYPFLKAYNFVFTNTINFFSSVNELKRLKEENIKLKNEIDLLKDIQYKANILEIQNKELKKLLEFQNSSEYKVVSAEIILKDPSNLFSVITVNKGSNHGIKKGNPVYTIMNGEKLLVGKVIELSFFYCKIMTIFDPRSYVSVKEYYSNYSGIAKGNAPEDNMLEVEYFPNDAEIFFDDLFVTAGYGGVYPPDLLIGKVINVQKQNFSIYQKIKLKPVLDLSKITYVLIILDYNIEDQIKLGDNNN
ncbi:MAG: rod shape-determining protein MreC [Exilispira sp.]